MAGIDPISAIVGVADKVLGAVLPDKAAKDAANARLLEMVTQGEISSVIGQLEVNKAEATSSSVFVAGWRPYIGWVCGTALLSDFLVRPLLTWIATLAGHPVAYPPLDLSTLLTLLMGMLGFGAMRSFDKANGKGNGS